MDAETAAKSFAALGHEGRLLAFRLLVEAGPQGLPAGEVARRTGALQNTSSSNLGILASTGLIRSHREGRSIIYSVAHGRFGELLEYLVQDCCGGRPELCAPFFAKLLEACSAGGDDEGREIGKDRPDGCC
ncbi:helix-turn-helix transcriptional regulator [Phenylobacterium sp.]|uniref:ArsR/SmtB family transcription factor n=1 Tax=Phenylobacterium sp. TaxID=1871053 RepID=UPI0025EFAC20|nr:helix-turn-helix transcriptional regulator [Phenylobacterium sp.]MBX3482424.1 helix-turn-helix transcriptional regulator [Phenylobacterium sp.]